MKEFVFDANALVRYFRRTPGFERVQSLVQQAKLGRAHLSISVVNLAEVLYVLARYFSEEQTRQLIETARAAVVPCGVDEKIAIDAGSIRIRYKLGLADCFAAELAMRTNATLVTADPEFARLGRKLKVLALPPHSA